MIIKNTLLLFFLIATLSHYSICMERTTHPVDEAERALFLITFWKDKPNEVLRAMYDAKNSKDGMKEISYDGFSASFRAEDDIVFLSFASDKVSFHDTLTYNFFLKCIGVGDISSETKKNTAPTITPSSQKTSWKCFLQ